MSDIARYDAHTRNATAYFETRAAADEAVNDLVAAGIPREQISVAGTGVLGTTPTSGDRTFWEELKDLFLPAEDRYAYAEGLRRGGVLVSVRSDNSDYMRILEILDRDGAVDLDKQEASWREEGWTGYPSEDAAPSTAPGIASQTDLRAAPSSETSAAPRMATAASGTEEVVPVYEEQLRVGKRDVSHGRVRIRSYVVETPVNEQVRLHSESVQVERRPVDRAVTPGEALFQDRVIEAEERAEEAVVAKETRVKEELTLRKTAEDRTQEISDSVRHTEVEIEDGRGRQGLTGAAADVSEQIAEHMDVIASDGVKIGTVDQLDGPDKIKLARSTSPDGQHHFIPLAWVDHVDAHVHLAKTAAEARAGW
ncbi:MAG: DUF2171 domain-containing protein [Acidobacteriaceae bacterium]|nr:DUF2171 domain-containing protein [Acidobacteriaceae bacterium]